MTHWNRRTKWHYYKVCLIVKELELGNLEVARALEKELVSRCSCTICDWRIRYRNKLETSNPAFKTQKFDKYFKFFYTSYQLLCLRIPVSKFILVLDGKRVQKLEKLVGIFSNCIRLPRVLHELIIGYIGQQYQTPLQQKTVEKKYRQVILDYENTINKAKRIKANYGAKIIKKKRMATYDSWTTLD
jgi:uncharacterized protein YifE (UPF0438 family)